MTFIVQADGKRAQVATSPEAPTDMNNLDETKRTSLVTLPGETEKRAKYVVGDTDYLVPRGIENGTLTNGSIQVAIHDPEAELSNTYACKKVAGSFVTLARTGSLLGTHSFAPNTRESQFEMFFSSLALTVTAQKAGTATAAHFKDCPVENGDHFCRPELASKPEHQGVPATVSCAIKPDAASADGRSTGELTLAGQSFPYTFDGHVLTLDMDVVSASGSVTGKASNFLILKK